MTIDEIMAEIIEDDCNGVTFTGGDPFYQVEGFVELAKRVKELGKNIWCYTGFTYEELTADAQFKPLLDMIDVLVDGPFEEKLKNERLPFRGSSNQKIIELRK